MCEDSLGNDLLAYITAQLGNHRGVPCIWKMNGEWWLETRKLIDPSGHPLWAPGARFSDSELLYGYPVEVTKEATVPELVPLTKEATS